jgi:hypothetical protein
MEKGNSKRDDLYREAEGFHTSLDRRLRMLLRKPYLSEDEELELKLVKKKKLFYKDIMEELKDKD